MMLGNGDKKQFKDINKLKEAITDSTRDMIIKNHVFCISVMFQIKKNQILVMHFNIYLNCIQKLLL